MKAASVVEIRKTLEHLDKDHLKQLCLRLARFKLENKELLTYLLFEADDELSYVQSIKNQLDGLFETRVENIMTPFSRVITVMSTATIMDSLENARLHGYSRYPVISENDEVKGVFI